MKIYVMERGNDTNRFGFGATGSAIWEEPHRISGISTTLQKGLEVALKFYQQVSEKTPLNLDNTWVCAREYEGREGSSRETGIVYVLKASSPKNILVKRGTDIVEQLQLE